MEHGGMWIAFGVLVLGSLAIDLGIFHRKAHAVGLREAAIWSIGWVSLATLFGIAVFNFQGTQKGIEFITGYVIEWSLSVDNLFVFLVIFNYFGVPAAYQHRVLFWGIMGALVMRGVFIALGVVLLARFHWIIYLFGAFLVYTGLKFLRHETIEVEAGKNPLVRLARRLFLVTPSYEGSRFFVARDGRWWATPLFIVLVSVEATDLAFAVDSIPAIFAITQDPFIVYTSNVFAILGLRALYFFLAAVTGLFRYLRYGLSIVLVFIGIKMLIADLFPIPTLASLSIITFVLSISVLASLFAPATSPIAPASNPAPRRSPHQDRDA